MKIRNDFVSNSSSCSFIVHDVKKSLTLIKKLGEIPYQVDDFEVRVFYKHKNERDIYKAFSHREPEDTNYYHWDNKREIDPDEIECFYDAGIYDLYELIENNDTKSIKKIEYIEFSCHNDYGLNTGFIKLLYMYFQKHGIKVTCEDTEIRFLDSNTFISNLIEDLMVKDK